MNQSPWPFVTTVTDVTNVSTSEQLALILETYCSFLPRLVGDFEDKVITRPETLAEQRSTVSEALIKLSKAC